MHVLASKAYIPSTFGELELRNYTDGVSEAQVVLPSAWEENASLGRPVVRIHSACFTGDLLGSLRCDCGPQLQWGLQTVQSSGLGAVIYLHQEGRGIGLSAKLLAYQKQDEGLDTVDANLAIGFKPDLRTYEVAVDILKDLGWSSISLLTNNPEKSEQLRALNVEVEPLPTPVFVNPCNESYLRTKRDRMGHGLAGMSLVG